MPGDEPPPQEGTGEVCPECGQGTLVSKTRPVRAVRRLLALSRLQVHQEGRPAAARSAPVRGRLPEEQGRPPRPASRATDRERLLGVLELPALRLHDEPRAARRPARRRRRAAGAQGRGGDLPDLRLDQRCRGGRHRAGREVPGRPAEPRGAGPAGARARRRTGWRSRRRPADVARGGAPGGRDHARGERARSSRPPTRERALGRRPRPTRPSRGSSARSPRETPRRTPSARTRPRSAPTSSGSPRVARTGGRPARADLRAYLGVLGEGRARSSVAQRLAAIRVVPPLGDARRLAPGDPWGAIATPRLPRRLPRVLEVEQVERLLAVVDEDLDAAPGRRPRAAPRSTRARAARPGAGRDRLRRGLRISELAAADLASLDLRRGEIRVLGKGRKERIGLLGRPARAALDRLPRGRPARPARAPRAAAIDAAARRDLPEPPRRAARRPRPALPARSAVRARRAAGRRLAAHAAPLVRDAPARRRRGPARRPGAARSREPRDDPDLHARLARSPAGRLSGGPPAGASRPRPVSAAGLARPRRADRVRRIPRLARPRLRPRLRHRQRVRRHDRARRVLRGVPDPGPDLPARRGRRPVVGADPDRVGPVHDRRARSRVAGRVDGHQPHAHRPGWSSSIGLFILAPVDRPGHHARVRGRAARHDHRADPDHAAQPDLPGDGRGRDERPQCRAAGSPRRPSRRSSTTSRSSAAR